MNELVLNKISSQIALNFSDTQIDQLTQYFIQNTMFEIKWRDLENAFSYVVGEKLGSNYACNLEKELISITVESSINIDFDIIERLIISIEYKKLIYRIYAEYFVERLIYFDKKGTKLQLRQELKAHFQKDAK